MTKKTWAAPTVTPLTAAKDAQLLGAAVSDGPLGKGKASS